MPFAIFFNGEKKSDDFSTRREAQRHALLSGIEMEQICGADPDKPPPKPVIPKKYFDFPTSELVVDIKPGDGDVTLELERAR